jgi:hypothetical protein
MGESSAVNTLALGVRTAQKASASHRSNSWLPTTIPLCDLCAMLFPLRLILAQPPLGHRSNLLTLNSHRFQPPEERLLGFHGQKDDEADANRQQPVTERDGR